MAKVTSKLQVTIPKAIATRYGIEPGNEIEFEPAGNFIRVVPAGRQSQHELSVEERLRLFDQETTRQRKREAKMDVPSESPAERDWQREDLYDRDQAR